MPLKIMQWNAHSLNCHNPELKHYIKTNKTPPDLICVAETYLKPTQNFTFPGYEIVRKDGEGAKPGEGVATLIRSGIKFQNINLKFNKIQAIATEIFYDHNKKVTVVNVYDPPDHLVDLEDYRQVFGIGGRVIVTGDFNAHNPFWKSERIDRRGECIEGILEDYDFTMLNTGQPTFQKAGGGMSVLVLSFASSSIVNRCEWSVINNALGSDHLPTIINISVNADVEINKDKIWLLKTANWPKFQTLLNDTESSHLFNNDVNVYNENITKTVINAANQTISKSNTKSKNKPKSAPYWNTACSKAIYNRNKNRNKLNKNKTTTNSIAYKRSKAVAQRTLRDAQKDCWQSYCNTLNKNTKLGKVWSMSKRMGGHRNSCFNVPTLKTDTGPCISNATKAEALAKTFAAASATSNYPDTFIQHKQNVETNLRHLFTNETPPNPNTEINQ